MKRVIGLSLLILASLAVQNNFPSLQLVVLLLPLCVVVALNLYQLPSNHVMAVVGVCLFYGSLSGAYAYAAGVGLMGLALVWLASQLRLHLVVVGVTLTAVSQLGFVMVGGGVTSLAAISFAVQLVVILVVSLKLAGGAEHARV